MTDIETKIGLLRRNKCVTLYVTKKGLLRRKKRETLELKRDSYVERNVKHWNLKGTLTLKEMSNIGT